MLTPLRNYSYRAALATLAVAALLLTTRTSLGQVDLAAQSRDAANYVNQVRANPAAFSNFSASLADADVEARQPLVWNVALQRAAERHAKHMADTNQFDHFMTINGQKVGMNLWMRDAGYPLVNWLRNDDTNFECIHFENGFDLNTIGRRVINGFLAEGKDGGHVRPLIGRAFWKGCQHIGIGMATSAGGSTFVSVLVGVFDPQNPSAQPPFQPGNPTPQPAQPPSQPLNPVPVPAVPVPAAPQAPRQQFQKADGNGGLFTSAVLANGTTQWVETSNKDPNFRATFEEKKRDNQWIHLFDAGRNMTVVLPVGGGMSHFSQVGGQNWTQLVNVSVGQVANAGQPLGQPANSGLAPSFPIAASSAAPLPGTAAPPLTGSGHAQPLTGTWKNRDGGTVKIVVNTAGLVQLTWFDAQNQVHSTGLGFVQDGHIFATWSDETLDYGINVFRIGTNGTLRSRYTSTKDGARTARDPQVEVATGGIPGTLEGNYATADGQMSVSKTGLAYAVNWFSHGRIYPCVAMRQGDLFVVGWSGQNNVKFGVVDYTILGNTLQGSYTRNDTNRVGTEILDRASAN